MKGVSRPLVQEVCTTCGNHDSFEQTWTMPPGTDLFAGIPFHAAHIVLETDQTQFDFEAKTTEHCEGKNTYYIRYRCSCRQD